MADYWTKYWQQRASRRRILGAAAVAGVGAAGLALVGCGDNSSGSSDAGRAGLATPTLPAGATVEKVDPFTGVKRGGTYKATITSDPPTIDPFANTSFQTKVVTNFVYSRLFRFKTGPGIAGTDVVPEGDLVSSAEVTPDGLKWTMKLKPNVKWHNVAPVNGRALSTDDIKYSWGRMTDPKNGNRLNFNFVDKMETPDANTIVFTLSGPNAGFKDLLADTTNLMILPAEADGKFDASKTMIGTGPWLFDAYTPSVTMKYKRNPEWFDKGDQNFPIIDAVELAIIPEYATRLAQFRAGNTDREAPNALDLVDVKKQIPDIVNVGSVAAQANYIWFDSDPNAPWTKDERVRQAISMSFPRDDLQDLAYDSKKLKAAGIDVKNPWNNVIPAGFTRFWLDPQGKDQGDTAKFYKFDPAEAKKLLSAAGLADGFSATYQYPGTVYGKAFNDVAEATIGYLNQVGIKTTTDVQDYASKWITQTFQGNFKGIAFGLETGFADVGGYSARLFTDNPNNHGRVKDADLVKLDTDQRLESNEDKRRAIFWEMQRKASQKMYYVPSQVGAGTTWVSYQPWLKNGNVFQTKQYGLGTEVIPYYWKTK